MKLGRGSGAGILIAVLWTPLAGGADFARYRGFQFGGNVAAAVKHIGARESEVRTIHTRPLLIQELEWRPGNIYFGDTKRSDPLRDVLLRFQDGKLFQIVAAYDSQRIEGLSEDDLIQAISLIYGNATRPAATISYHSNYGVSAPVIARWEDPAYSYSLVRTGDRMSFALILSSKRLLEAAEAAMAESKRLDVLEAPQRAIDTKKRLQAEERSDLDKARSVNLPNFRP